MSDKQQEIMTLLTEVFPLDSNQIHLVDDVGDDRHFTLSIESPLFEDKSRIERSQMVYGILNGLMKTDSIHALTLKLTPSTSQH